MTRALTRVQASLTGELRLLTLLNDALPRGTPVELNRVPGQHVRLGDVR